MQRNKNGFTLIELLIVIAIIGLLASIVLVSLSNARVKARDAKRQADIKNLMAAFELYYNDVGHYPVYGVDGTAYYLTTAMAGASPVFGTSYMNSVPVDPLYGMTNTGSYQYVYTHAGGDYGILVDYESTGYCKYRTSGGASGWWGVADCTK